MTSRLGNSIGIGMRTGIRTSSQILMEDRVGVTSRPALRMEHLTLPDTSTDFRCKPIGLSRLAMPLVPVSSRAGSPMLVAFERHHCVCNRRGLGCYGWCGHQASEVARYKSKGHRGTYCGRDRRDCKAERSTAQGPGPLCWKRGLRRSSEWQSKGTGTSQRGLRPPLSCE